MAANFLTNRRADGSQQKSMSLTIDNSPTNNLAEVVDAAGLTQFHRNSIQTIQIINDAALPDYGVISAWLDDAPTTR